MIFLEDYCESINFLENPYEDTSNFYESDFFFSIGPILFEKIDPVAFEKYSSIGKMSMFFWIIWSV